MPMPGKITVSSSKMCITPIANDRIKAPSLDEVTSRDPETLLCALLQPIIHKPSSRDRRKCKPLFAQLRCKGRPKIRANIKPKGRSKGRAESSPIGRAKRRAQARLPHMLRRVSVLMYGWQDLPVNDIRTMKRSLAALNRAGPNAGQGQDKTTGCYNS